MRTRTCVCARADCAVVSKDGFWWACRELPSVLHREVRSGIEDRHSMGAAYTVPAKEKHA